MSPKFIRLRRCTPLLLACALPLVMALAACGSPDSLALVDNGELVVTPDVLTFNPQGVGETNVQYLTLHNGGQATVIINSLDLSTRSDEFGLGDVELPLRLAPGDDRVIEVAYTPADCEIDRGSLVIHSNDRDHGELTVPLQPQDLGGQVTVTPSPVDFGRVPASTSKTIPVTLANTGTCALEVNDVFLTGSGDFAITQPAGEGVMDYSAQLEASLPLDLAPGQTYSLDITFAPSNDGYDEATLIVRSDDSRHRNIDTDVFANGAAPCIVVTDEDGIDYGARFIGESHAKTVTITNCNQRQPLEVYSISLGPHPTLSGAETFSLDGLPDLTSPVVLDPGASVPFTLTYAPVSEQPDGAMLTITSNDEVKTPLDIEVRGIGTNNQCPVAVARARVQSSGGPWDTQIDTIPLATLELDGSGSTDGDGTIASYLWEVTQRPDDSTAQLNPRSGDTVNPTFFLDLAGSYVFSLRVYDASGVESCEPATVMAIATPNEDIHVQLVWNTDGTDVDLHFMRDGGTWDGNDDCHWKNTSPNWGGSGRNDDPSLDIDDVDGFGPENINLDNPETGKRYSIGVFYYDDWGQGASDVTVRIYIGGVERFANTYFNLQNYGPSDGQFWHVAHIDWPSGDITRINRLYPNGFP